MSSVRFIHTADWQVGKPYRNVSEPNKRYRLQTARLNSVKRITEIAKEYKVDFVAVCGDLFDSSTVPIDIVMEVLEIIGSLEICFYVIPGNHDHGGAAGIWRRADVQRELKSRAPLLKLLNIKQPVNIGKAVILPCPLLRRQELEDPCKWISRLDWNELPKKLPKIVMAHGSITKFVNASNELTDIDNLIEREFVNTITLDNINMDHVDYVALGDWHNLKKINEHIWYCGTPEQDKFNITLDDKRSQILMVECINGKKPNIDIIDTGELKWHEYKIHMTCGDDIDCLELFIKNQIGSRVSNDLLKLEIDGNLSLEEFKRFDTLIKSLHQQLIYFKIKGSCRQKPNSKELISLTNRREDPLISSIAKRLKEEHEIISKVDDTANRNEETLKVLETALCELYRITHEIDQQEYNH